MYARCETIVSLAVTATVCSNLAGFVRSPEKVQVTVNGPSVGVIWDRRSGGPRWVPRLTDEAAAGLCDAHSPGSGVGGVGRS